MENKIQRIHHLTVEDHILLIYYKFLGQGQTINQHVYLKMLKGSRESIQKNSNYGLRSEFPHYNKTPAQDTLGVHEKCVTKMEY